MSDSLWTEERAQRYIKLYGDPRKKIGTQSLLCRDASRMIAGESVLDFGCGMGHLVPYIQKPDQYVGLDYSEMMLTCLENFFPDIRTIHGDATLPYDSFKGTLEAAGVPTEYDTCISLSLIIHLPRIQDIEALLHNMWNTCTKTMLFGVETVGDVKQVRSDGLTLRNVSVTTILGMLDKLGIGGADEAEELLYGKVTHVHQKITLRQYITMYPLASQLSVNPKQEMYTRTTLFRVEKL